MSFRVSEVRHGIQESINWITRSTGMRRSTSRVMTKKRVQNSLNYRKITNTKLHSKDNAAARRMRRRRITNTLRTPTTQPTKLAEECGLVYAGKNATAQVPGPMCAPDVKDRGCKIISACG